LVSDDGGSKSGESLLQDFYDMHSTVLSEKALRQTLMPDSLNVTREFNPLSTIYKYGVNIVTLWKYIMLRKRILIVVSDTLLYGPCKDCYSIFMMGSPYTSETRPCRLEFLTCLADIQTLEFHDSYVAVTTDKIICQKKDLFDLMVHNSDGTIEQTHLVFHGVSKSDKTRFRHLLEICDAYSRTPRVKSRRKAKVLTENEYQANPLLSIESLTSQRLWEYFQQLNTTIYNCMKRLKGSKVEAKDVQSMGFQVDRYDIKFLEEY
jgi:hypothetical protein